MINEQVRTLSSRFIALEQGMPDYWTFDGRDQRVGAHAMFHYPAMMVPQMQGAILDHIREVAPGVKKVLDPFVGSGTTLVESMARGLDFVGVDINPLAILISRAKATVLSPASLRGARARVAVRIADDRDTSYFVSFENQKKWFSRSASIGLSRVARAIELELDADVRRVFWVVLARIVRSVCNSRTSTYKLHAKEKADEVEQIDPTVQFDLHSTVVISSLEAHYKLLQESNSLTNGAYRGKVNLRVGNILTEEACAVDVADVVITSPPYGDNRTTIPYGQYSYLPLRWIPLDDIEEGLDSKIVSNTHATDTASLGGALRGALTRGDEACGSYEVYRSTMASLVANENGKKRFASFAADLRKSVELLAKQTSQDGFHVWTVGERRIGGTQVPMAQLVEEMLASEGIHLIHAASRRILSKRMASRNPLSETMGSEQVLIARRQSL